MTDLDKSKVPMKPANLDTSGSLQSSYAISKDSGEAAPY